MAEAAIVDAITTQQNTQQKERLGGKRDRSNSLNGISLDENVALENDADGTHENDGGTRTVEMMDGEHHPGAGGRSGIAGGGLAIDSGSDDHFGIGILARGIGGTSYGHRGSGGAMDELASPNTLETGRGGSAAASAEVFMSSAKRRRREVLGGADDNYDDEVVDALGDEGGSEPMRATGWVLIFLSQPFPQSSNVFPCRSNIQHYYHSTFNVTANSR